MKRAIFEQELNRILIRLNQILEQDKHIVDPRGKQPVEVTLDELLGYGRRYDERQELHEELKALGSQPIED